MPSIDDSLRFPYMVWAHEEAFRSPWSLSQSGVPAPDPTLLGDPPPIDLSPPAAEALPAVNERLAELFGLPTDRLLVTAGTSAAMSLAAQYAFRGGARVVTEVPSYEPFRALPELWGADLRVVPRRVEDDFALDVERVEAELEGLAPGQRGHVFVANPHNPTGQVLSREQLERLALAAERAGGLLVSNEVYMEFATPAERLHAFDLAPNTLSLGSLTKAYGLGPLRIGWILLGEALADELPQLRDHAYLNYVDLPTPALRVARLALDRLEALLAPARRYEAECRPHLVRFLRDTPGVRGPAPRLGLSAFPRIEGVEDTLTLSRFLAAEHGVDAVPGEAFGLPGHLRLGYGVPEETLREGLVRLAAGIEAFTARPPAGG